VLDSATYRCKYTAHCYGCALPRSGFQIWRLCSLHAKLLQLLHATTRATDTYGLSIESSECSMCSVWMGLKCSLLQIYPAVLRTPDIQALLELHKKYLKLLHATTLAAHIDGLPIESSERSILLQMDANTLLIATDVHCRAMDSRYGGSAGSMRNTLNCCMQRLGSQIITAC
jgi:hypothetical protein